MALQVFSIKEKPELRKYHSEIGDRVWPVFMGNDSVLLNNWEDLYRTFPEYQLTFINDGKIVGMANSIPFYRDMPLENLPEEGWDWVLLKGLKDKKDNSKPNTLSGLQVAIDTPYQNKGYSPLMVKEMRQLASRMGLPHLVVPLRPTMKSMHPLMPISQYVAWKREDGLPYDPWLRVHVKIGARIIKPCNRSMYITGSISKWEEWTGKKFPKSGEYNIDGALTLIKIDLKRNIGEYIEPNIWIVHEKLST